MAAKELNIYPGQHLYCDFDQSGLGDTCLFCRGDVRFVSYTPCPSGYSGKITLYLGKHLFIPGRDECLFCQDRKEGCTLDPEAIYLQY